MNYRLADLASIATGTLLGNGDSKITGVCSIDQIKPYKICYITEKNLCRYIQNDDHHFYIVKPEQQELISHGIIHEDPAKAFRLIAEQLVKKNPKSGIEPTAIVSKTAQIGKNVYIGHYVVIGEHVQIADHVQIKPQTIIEDHCQIGAKTQIDNHVIIAAQTIIGSDCHIYSGAVIGGEGFGYNFEAGNWKHVPQLGKVIIGNSVEIGSNSTIDRGAINDTIVGDNVIIDNLVHLGHNVEVGKSTAMAAFAGIAGSTKIGNYCMIGGKVGVNGHIHICDNTQINAGSNVFKTIAEPGSYSSVLPAIPTRKWNKIAIYLQRIEDLFKKRKNQRD